MFNRTKEKCIKCEKVVYPDDRVVVDQKVWHETCFRCAKCKTKLNLGTYAELGGTYYCKPHMQEAFRLAGSYSFTDKEKEKEFHASTPKITYKSQEDIINSVREGENATKSPYTDSSSPIYSSNEDTLYNKGAITQQMVSTDDMMSVEDQLARLKRQLDKNIISKEQYDQKRGELERRQSGDTLSRPTAPTVSIEITPRQRTNSRPSMLAGSPVKSEVQSLSPSMRRLMDLHGSNEPEQTEQTEPVQSLQSGISSLSLDNSNYNKNVEEEKSKLSGLLARGIISQVEFDALLTPQALLQRNIITQEEHDLAVNGSTNVATSNQQNETEVPQLQTDDAKAKALLDKGIITVDEYNKIVNATTPNPGIEQSQVDEERRKDLTNRVQQETSHLDSIAAKIEQKRREIETLTQEHDKQSQVVQQLQIELEAIN
ncbi:LIM domain and actin-binding protein [Acrasis kona]|uniref:LIM domain and actin-binding protein n=1 Tax=Acrasis kona TaxID=1008807 RepID=A0AAW2ZCV9_9EUKA